MHPDPLRPLRGDPLPAVGAQVVGGQDLLDPPSRVARRPHEGAANLDVAREGQAVDRRKRVWS